MKTIRWNDEWRGEILSRLNQDWDLVIIGGGITGAGIFRSAVSAGLKTLLLEASDFAFGTSSRSSKLVHGGFRYLYNKQYHVTYESVTERQRLLREAPALIDPLAFNLPNYDSYRIPSWMFNAGLAIYDFMGAKWDHRALSFQQMQRAIPGLSPDGFRKGFRYFDAVLDDARLVFRIIRETVADGGTALNYARVVGFLRDRQGGVRGVTLQDMSSPQQEILEIAARAVINASGPWSDQVRSPLQMPDKLRPLRGSHIILPGQRLPVTEAVTFFHPHDKRAMFVIPWEGTTMVGTTDIDHSGANFQASAEPFADRSEIDYILAGVSFLFPLTEITHKDILSTFAGLRPVINTGAATPSKESRAHQVWIEHGLITVSGGKLTTFRIMARDTLEQVARVIGQPIKIDPRLPMLKPLGGQTLRSANPLERRLLGRSGVEASTIIKHASTQDLQHINGLPASWAELKFAASSEAVIHLDDLLLRRTRVGMLLPQGGRMWMPDIRAAVQDQLDWSDQRWQQEHDRYFEIWKRYYSPNPGL